jgi:hypothetical protein
MVAEMQRMDQALVEVALIDGHRLQGRVVRVGTDDFDLRDPASDTITTLQYADLSQVVWLKEPTLGIAILVLLVSLVWLYARLAAEGGG